MHLVLLPGERPRRSIVVQTRAGTNLDNEQLQDISAFELSQFRDLERRYPGVTVRPGSATPIYNCHGLAFASRRTGIFDRSELDTALIEDQYHEIPRSDVMPGDLVLYFGESGDLEHSGVVVSEPDRLLGIPRIVSKWGKWFEVVHWLGDCPYSSINVRFYRVRQ